MFHQDEHETITSTSNQVVFTKTTLLNEAFSPLISSEEPTTVSVLARANFIKAAASFAVHSEGKWTFSPARRFCLSTQFSFNFLLNFFRPLPSAKCVHLGQSPCLCGTYSSVYYVDRCRRGAVANFSSVLMDTLKTTIACHYGQKFALSHVSTRDAGRNSRRNLAYDTRRSF